MRRLFRSFDRFGVRYLLISGQASVLYGAATFSEDVDVWIDPTTANVRRLLTALQSLRARYGKLTPPLSRRNLLAGHGFHFVIPGRPLPVYLDVMGRPPRVGAFAAALRRAPRLAVESVVVPVVAPDDLVRLKLTRRLSDYEVISELARIGLAAAGIGKSRGAALRWGSRWTFRADDRVAWSRELGREISIDKCRRQVAAEISEHQTRDTVYWRRRIAELRRFFRAGTLLPRGTPVRCYASG